MISVKHLKKEKNVQIIIEKNQSYEPAHLVAKSRIKHPEKQIPLNSIYVVKKGECLWDKQCNDYVFVKDKKRLSMSDLFLIDWDRSQ